MVQCFNGCIYGSLQLVLQREGTHLKCQKESIAVKKKVGIQSEFGEHGDRRDDGDLT